MLKFSRFSRKTYKIKKYCVRIGIQKILQSPKSTNSLKFIKSTTPRLNKMKRKQKLKAPLI